MTALVLTAWYGYADPDRLDITRMRATMPGLALAPSWALLRPYKALARAGQLTDAHWSAYRAAYVAEMRASYRRHRDAWREIAARALVSDVALVCFCGDPARCHRSVAAELLVAAAPRLLDGATLEYVGEAGGRGAHLPGGARAERSRAMSESYERQVAVERATRAAVDAEWLAAVRAERSVVRVWCEAAGCRRLATLRDDRGGPSYCYCDDHATEGGEEMVERMADVEPLAALVDRALAAKGGR